MSSPNQIDPATFTELGLTRSQPKKLPTKELGQPEFFDLMLAQLKYQDPTKPLDNTEFIGQMAQFSTVNSLSSMESSLSELVGAFHSNQALQASTLVGRDVLVPSPRGRLEDGGSLHGAVEFPDGAQQAKVSIADATGEVVATIELGNRAAGRVPFEWNGMKDDGQRARAGSYSVHAQGVVGEQTIAAETLVRTRVDSVTLAQNPPGATLNLSGLGAVDMSVVRELL